MIFRITRAHKYQFLETWLYPIPFHFNLTGPLIFSFLRKMFDQGREDSVEEEILAKTERDEKKERTLLQDTLQLTFCAGGLQVSYLTWGILQVSVSLYLYKQKFSLIVVFFVFLGGGGVVAFYPKSKKLTNFSWYTLASVSGYPV